MFRNDAIVINSLIKQYYEQVALNAIPFSIKIGSVVGIIQRKGAEKTPVEKISARVITGISGDILINGNSPTDNAMRAKRHVSFMPDNNLLPDHLQMGKYLRFGQN
jgi:ABC-2 type transport system ATP-binding protein